MPETIQPHILVVDDDPQIRDLLKEYLAQNELRVSVDLDRQVKCRRSSPSRLSIWCSGPAFGG